MDLNDEEVMLTRIINGAASRKEIIKYMQNKISELELEKEKYKEAFLSRVEYTRKLEEDLFNNCENYVVNKTTIANKIEELNKEILPFYTHEDVVKILEKFL